MKRSYHSDLIIQYQLGILPKALLKEIPSSTLDNWKKRDSQQLFGLEHVHDFKENLDIIKKFLAKKSLMNAAKSLYLIHCTYVRLFEKAKGRGRIIKESQKIILQTIDRVKPFIGQKRALRAFDISYQQFYAWKQKVLCPLNPPSLCRK